MLDLSPQQMQVLERLIAAGFRPVEIRPFENVLCVRRGDCVAVLVPTPGGGLRVQAPPAWFIEGNLGVRIRRGGRNLFVWKSKEVEATPERNAELQAFERDLTELLRSAAPQ